MAFDLPTSLAKKAIVEVIRELMKKYGGAVPVEKVYERGYGHGIPKEEIKEFLISEHERGTLYFPRGGSLGRPPWDEQFGGVVETVEVPKCSGDDEVSVSSIELIEGQSKKVALICGGWHLVIADFSEEFYIVNLKSFEQDGEEIYANVETANCSLPNPFRPRLGVAHSLSDLPQKFEDLPLGHYRIEEDTIEEEVRIERIVNESGMFSSVDECETVKILKGQQKLDEFFGNRGGINNKGSESVASVCIGCGVDLSNKKSYCKGQVCKKCFNDGWRILPPHYGYQTKQQVRLENFAGGSS